MDTFFTILKRGLIASVFVMFATVMLYTPQDWNSVKAVHAGGATGGALEVTQLANNALLNTINAVSAANAATNASLLGIHTTLVTKELALDGIAWAVVKALVQTMINDLIVWIQSGFSGSPAFVEDLSEFLLNESDKAVGAYISELGGAASFLCDPFKLDVQVAVSQHYDRIRVDQPIPECTLTDVIGNFEDFTDGARGSFSHGGWNDWFDVTADPIRYSKYGNYLAAEEAIETKKFKTEEEQSTIVEIGNGFMSQKQCSFISGPAGPVEDCSITTPGKLMQEALSFNLDSGRQSLVAADEIDEIIGALISTLATSAFTGSTGLLGL